MCVLIIVTVFACLRFLALSKDIVFAIYVFGAPQKTVFRPSATRTPTTMLCAISMAALLSTHNTVGCVIGKS